MRLYKMIQVVLYIPPPAVRVPVSAMIQLFLTV